MIAEVDDGLRSLVKREALNGSDVDLSFEAPTKEWAGRRNTPTVDFYLYDIREDLKWRAYGSVDVKDANGHTIGRQAPPKYFRLSYLVTAWTQRPEDEHRLLSAILLCLLKHPMIPPSDLSGAILDQGVPVRLSVALPPPDERTVSEVWTALGGELKPSLDVGCLMAVDVDGIKQTAPPVLEIPRFRFDMGAGGASGPARPVTVASEETAGGGIRRGRRPDAGEPDVEVETVTAGTEEQPGRTFTFRTMAGDIDR